MKRSKSPKDRGRGEAESLSNSLQRSTDEVSDRRDSDSEVLKEREQAAVQYRHWVRLTRVCNQRCLFCLDTDAQDGTFLPTEELKREIMSGFRGEGGRLILSGGEPTIHPDFIELVRYGREVGFKHIQTITNGRMFAYKKFLEQAAEAGLVEITFSIHGHTPELHDKLVGVKGAFAQTLRGLKNALEHGGIIVNIDICINKLNYPYLDEMLAFFERLGVHEFDLLQVIPFGRAWENRDLLLYNVEEAFPYLNRAFKHARIPGNFVWTNRFPVQYLEGLEDLIQDPHKLHDEVRGRREQFERYLATGTKLSCYGERCKYCFIDRFCAKLYQLYDAVLKNEVRVVAADLTGAHAAPEYGAPAASKDEIAARLAEAFTRLPVEQLHLEATTLSEVDNLLATISDKLNQVKLSVGVKQPPTAEELRAVLSKWPLVRLACECADESLFELLEVVPVLEVRLDAAVAVFVLKNVNRLIDYIKNGRLVFGYAPRSLLSEVNARDSSWRRFFAGLKRATQIKPKATGVPFCFEAEPDTNAVPLDTALWLDLLDEHWRLVMHRFVEWYIRYAYFVQSVRCQECELKDQCRGAHINYIRKFGFRELQPIGNDRD